MKRDRPKDGGNRLPRRAIIGAGAAGTAAAIGVALLDDGSAEASGTDRGGTYVVVAADAGSPWVGNGDAQCSGDGDQETINEAIDTVAGLGGGRVELSRGSFHIAEPILMRSNVSLVGQGPQATVLNRGPNDDAMVRIEGTSESRAVRSGIEDLTIGGGDETAPGVTCHFAALCAFRRVYFVNVHHYAVDGVEFWDSTFLDCRFDDCGSVDGSGKPAVSLVTSRSGTRSSDNCNNIHFTNCTWETFVDGAIELVGTGGGGGAVNKCHFTNCKVETVSLGGPPVKLDRCSYVTFRNLNVTVTGFDDEFSTPQDYVAVTNSNGIFIDGYLAEMVGDERKARTFLRLEDNSNVGLDNLVWVDGSAGGPTVAAVEYDGTNRRVDVGLNAWEWNPSDAPLVAGESSLRDRFVSAGTVSCPAETGTPVTHHLHRAPTLAEIWVTANGDLGAGGRLWTSDPTADTFTINRAGGATSAVDVAWRAVAP